MMGNQNRKIKLGVLGLGSIGRRHCMNIASLGIEVAGFDPDPSGAEFIAGIGGSIYESRDDFLEEMDAIVVASPTQFHFKDILDGIEAGCHLLVEKPLAHSLANIEGVLAEAKDKGLVIAGAFNLRFLPTVSFARNLIKNTELGEVLWARFTCASYLPDWRPGRNYLETYANDPLAGGVLMDVVHEIDLAEYLLGPAQLVASAVRNTGSIGLAAEDCADLVFRHEKGLVSTVHLDYVTKKRMRTVEVIMERGSLEIQTSNNKVIVNQFDSLPERKELVWSESPLESYLEELKDFIGAVEGRHQVRCSGEEALKSLKLALEARCTYRSGF